MTKLKQYLWFIWRVSSPLIMIWAMFLTFKLTGWLFFSGYNIYPLWFGMPLLITFIVLIAVCFIWSAGEVKKLDREWNKN